MLSTSFTDLVGCTVPVQVAPMGAISTPELIAAVTSAGAFGMVGTAGMSVAQVEHQLDAVEERCRGPFGANMLMPFRDPDLVRAVAPRVRVFDFYHGHPDAELVELVHEGGALAGWQVGSLAEARAAVDVGCDVLAVRGVEGGGRMHGSEPLWPLLNQVLDAVEVPVLAAGGLATARDLAASLAAGAAGVRMGTRFVATVESGAHQRYKDAIVAAGSDDTVLVSDFSVFWPEGPAPHRVLTRSLEAAAGVEDDVVGETVLFGERVPVPKYAMVPPTIDASGTIEAFAMYAGVSAGSITSIEPAGDVVREITEGAARRLDAVRS